MADRPSPPPFEIVIAEDASTNAVKRLRTYVSINPEDTDRLPSVAERVVTDLAGNNDVVVIFFHFGADAAGKSPAEARAQYVRNGLKQGYVPPPLKSDRRMHRLEMPNGLMTVETARAHE